MSYLLLLVLLGVTGLDRYLVLTDIIGWYVGRGRQVVGSVAHLVVVILILGLHPV